jgi:predicted RNA binding protein YcfA (HicA-like mRNA interferase family)
MNYRQLTRKLRRMGWEMYRQAAGSHEVWWDPKTGKRTVISNHGRIDIPAGTLRAIARDIGITVQELLEK